MRSGIALLFIWACGLLAVFATPAQAHEIRPALLSLEQQDETASPSWDVTWKRPIIAGRLLNATPIFPDSCQSGPAEQEREPNAVVERFTLNGCRLESGTIRIDGLERTLTDAFIRFARSEGGTQGVLIKPADPTLDLTQPTPPAAQAYFGEGILHIVLGWDHLLFVLGLCLLVERRQLLGVATSFAIAHSLTLIISTLGLFSLPSRPVEILIGASILLLALEVMRKWQGIDGLTARRPYLVSFGIGLIHGLGFAGALSDLGLPKGQELLSLILFNFGVEFGQFAIIAAALILAWMAKRAAPKAVPLAATCVVYGIGAISAYWVIERLAGYVV